MGSLDDLIRFLIDEIALAGEVGLRPSRLFQCVDTFYSTRKLPSLPPYGLPADPSCEPQFRKQIWDWLTQQPGIQVTRNGSVVSQASTKRTRQALYLINKQSTRPPVKSQTGHGLVKSRTALFSHVSEFADPLSPELDSLTIYASRDQIWQAVTGHGPDFNKVQALEFICLSVIASFREKGVVQADLIRITGQDKRSVPARTKKLHENGYIEKLPIILKSAKTSLLVLKRFADVARTQFGSREPAEEPKEYGLGRYLDHDSLIKQAIGVTKVHQTILWDDLKRTVGIWRLPRESKILAEAVRKLEDVGVVNRVRSPSDSQVLGHGLHRCVKFLRDPEESDWETLFGPNPVKPKVLPKNNRTGSMSHSRTPDSLETLKLSVKLPAWEPLRPLSHIIRDVVVRASTVGMSLMDIRGLVAGSFYERPIESQVNRLAVSWQRSQPLHLRHLAILRDSEQRQRRVYYVHYTYINFGVKVTNSDATWEAVQSVPEEPEVIIDDENFSNPVVSEWIRRANTSPTLKASFFSAKVEPYEKTVRDALVVKMDDGTYELKWGVQSRGRPLKTLLNQQSILNRFLLTNSAYADSITALQTRPKKPEPQGPKRPRGRPRKTVSDSVSKITKKKTTRSRKQLYSPSVLAHRGYISMDIVGPSEVTTNAADVPQPVTTMLGYLPSAFAHGCSVGKIKHKRKKQAKSLAAPASLSPERLLELEVEPKEPKAKANRILPQRALAAHLPLSASTYDEQQARIDRPNPGCFVGEPATLKRSHGRGRPPRSRLMIIKSLRLHDLGLTSDVSQNRFAEPKQTANLPQLQGFLSPRQDYTSPYPTNYQNGKSGSHFVTGDSVQVPDELPGLVSTPDPPILNSKRKHVAFADTQTFDRRKKQKLEGSGLNSQSMNAHRNPSQYPTDTIFSHDGSVQTSQDHPQVYNDQSRQNITFDRGSMVNERPASMLGASLPSDHHRQGPYSQLVEELLMEASPGSAIGSGYQSINPASSISDHQLSSHRATEDADERSGKTGESGKRTVPAPQSTQSTDKQRNRPSGSVKVERRNIIMDVVQKFEGVFSGEKELWYHFATVWMARHGGTKPDYRTVKETKKDLINSRKLKLLTFNFEFKPRNGVFEPRTITILTLPNVPSDDPKVRQLKDRMIAAQPAPYFPEGLEISRAVCLKYTKPPKPSTEPKPQSYTNKLALDVNTIVQRQFPTPEGQSKGQSKAGSMTRRSRKRPTDEENASPRKRQKPSNFIFMPIEVGPATPAYPVPSGDLDTLPKLTNRKPRQHVNGKPRQQVNGKQSQQVDGTQSQQVDGKQKQHTNGKHTTAAKLLQYSVLNPRQIFNNHNGTISSMFVPRIRLPRTKEVKISFSKDPPRGRPQDIVSFRPDDHDGDPKAIFDRKVDAIKQWEHLGGGFHSQSDGREFTFVNHLFEGVHNNTCALGISLKAPRSRRGTHKTSVKEPKPHTARKLRARGDGKPIVKAKPPVEQPTLVDSDGRKFKRIRLRGPQRGKILGQDGDHRLFLGVVIARTLVGGVSQIVDWNIVAKMFEPQASEASLKSAWPRTRELLKSVGEKWQSDFQEMFAQAYATGAIPMVDYDNLKSYDWKHLFDWTWERFSSPSQSQAEISASTTGFTTLHELDGNPLQDMTAFYELRSNATVHKRDDIVNRDPFLVSVDTERLSDRTNLMDVAKNWIRANVLTPDGLYAPWEARRKIEPIGPKRVTKAIRELLLAKVITQKNKGRVLPTQGFKISSHFNNRLRLKFGLDKLYEAAAQKQRLDGLFKQGKRAQFSSHCSDGEMMAVSNLLAQGRIKSYQNNVPKNSFGLLDDGYRTRMMDRTKLHFDIELERSETYIEGNPLEPLPSIPTVVCQKVEEGHSFDKVPMWANFDGVADLSRWHSALAATIAIVVQRPGVVVSQIQIIVAPSLEPFEIKLLMDWMVKARIARWTGPWCDGVVLGEWWWMALGDERKSGAKATTSVAHG